MVYRLDSSQILTLIGGQLAWLVVTSVLAVALWRAGIRRFESVGG